HEPAAAAGGLRGWMRKIVGTAAGMRLEIGEPLVLALERRKQGQQRDVLVDVREVAGVETVSVFHFAPRGRGLAGFAVWAGGDFLTAAFFEAVLAVVPACAAALAVVPTCVAALLFPRATGFTGRAGVFAAVVFGVVCAGGVFAAARRADFGAGRPTVGFGAAG